MSTYHLFTPEIRTCCSEHIFLYFVIIELLFNFGSILEWSCCSLFTVKVVYFHFLSGRPFPIICWCNFLA